MIHPLKAVLVLAIVLSALPASLAWGADTVPSQTMVGKFGFDWLQPAKAKCTAITEQTSSTFKSCSSAGPNSAGSFTGKKDFYTCKVAKKSEYLIYKTKARCSEELETMMSNAE